MTELLGCHGSSGAGILQPAGSGFWELLGPAQYGEEELNDYLCNHVPGLDGSQHAPGSPGLRYGGLGVTQHLRDQLRADLEADCLALPTGATSLFTYPGCPLANLARTPENADFVERLVVPSAASELEALPGSVLRLSAGESASLSGFDALSASGSRLGMVALPVGGCGEQTCPELVVTLQGEPILRYAFGSTSAIPVPLAASATLVTSDPPVMTFSVVGGGSLEIGSISLVPEDYRLSFDRQLERLTVALQDLTADTRRPMPMRFVGDGQSGFAARLLPQERLLLNRHALIAGRQWTVGFDARGEAVLECGLSDASGTVVAQVDCSGGDATLADATLERSARAAFFIENRDADLAAIDDVRLASEPLPDGDEGGIADWADDCPDGGLPAPAVLDQILPPPRRTCWRRP